MNYHIRPSKKYLKAVKKCEQSGRSDVLVSLKEVVQLLAVFNATARLHLREEWRDHALRGNLQGVRELHLGYDDLLLYSIDEENFIVELWDIVNHEELQKRKR